MRDSLKHIFSKQITLEDKSKYYYTVRPYELTNVLGSSIAVLQEYDFAKQDDNAGQFSCKLYKTKEGNWYEIEETKKITVDKRVIRMLKSAIDALENNLVVD